MRPARIVGTGEVCGQRICLRDSVIGNGRPLGGAVISICRRRNVEIPETRLILQSVLGGVVQHHACGGAEIHGFCAGLHSGDRPIFEDRVLSGYRRENYSVRQSVFDGTAVFDRRELVERAVVCRSARCESRSVFVIESAVVAVDDLPVIFAVQRNGDDDFLKIESYVIIEGDLALRGDLRLGDAAHRSVECKRRDVIDGDTLAGVRVYVSVRDGERIIHGIGHVILVFPALRDAGFVCHDVRGLHRAADGESL